MPCQLTLHRPTNSPMAYYTAGKHPHTIIFLHPIRSTSLRLKKIIQHFAKHYTVIAPDFPGYGQTPPLNQTHTMDQYARLTADWLNHSFTNQPYDLFGFSMGGIVAVKTLKLLETPPQHLLLMGSPWKSSYLRLNPVLAALFRILRKNYSSPRKSIVQLANALINSPQLMFTIYKTLFPQLTSTQIKYEIQQWHSQPIFVFIENLLDIVYQLDLTQEAQSSIPTIYLYSPEDNFTHMNRNIRSVQKTLPNSLFIPLPFKTHVPKGDLTPQLIEQLKPIFNQILQFLES